MAHSHMPSWRKNLCLTALHITQALGGKSRVDGGGGGHGNSPQAWSEKKIIITLSGCYHTILFYIIVHCVIQNSVSI